MKKIMRMGFSSLFYCFDDVCFCSSRWMFIYVLNGKVSL